MVHEYLYNIFSGFWEFFSVHLYDLLIYLEKPVVLIKCKEFLNYFMAIISILS